MGGCRAIVKDMAKVAAAAGAEDLGTGHAERYIADLGYVLRSEGPVETGPACARVELRAGGKEWQATAVTKVNAILVVIEQVAAEGSLGPLGPQNAVGSRAKLFLPLGIGFHDSGTLNNWSRLAIGGDQSDGDGIGVAWGILGVHDRYHRKQQGRGQEMTGDHGNHYSTG